MKNLRLTMPLIALLLTLTFLAPAVPVQGEVTADFSITATFKKDVSEDHWKVYINEDITFVASGDEAHGYTWDFGDETTQYKESSTTSHNYTKVGKYQVVLTINNEKNETAKKWGNLTIVELPDAILVVRDKSGNILGPDITIKVGEEVTLDGNSSKGDIQTFIFGIDLTNAFLPQRNTQDEGFYELQYQETGTYNVALKVTDELGSSDQMQKSEFISITVTRGGSTDNGGTELPVGIEIIGGALAIVLVIILIVFLYRNGYIGGMSMGGGGGAPPPSQMPGSMPPPPPQSGAPAKSLNSLMGSQAGPDPALPDPSSFMQDNAGADFGKPPADETVYEVKNCPKCKGKIPITSLERPLKVVCPTCSASFSLKGKPKSTTPMPSPTAGGAGAAAAPVAGATASKPDFIYDFKDCPKCKSKIPITSEDRPLKVTCPGCSASFTLKGKSGGSSAPSPAPKTSAPPAPADDTEIVICPACGKAQPVSASASAANCVSCDARFEL